ncbi:MAG TPA: thiamine diphosphokinase [Dehalococcoidia bacterium]|nr:thiamine diphosphokinase [Dehalococcoidia bacterium]
MSGAHPRRAVVAAGVPIVGTPIELDAMAEADLRVAADSGAETLLRFGFTPHCLVGDLDSVDPHVVDRLRSAGVEVITYPERKDYTDTHLALRLARDRGAGDIALVGGAGGERLDHALANIAVLAGHEFRRVRMRLVSGYSEAHVVRSSLRIRGRRGEIVSLLPVTSVVRGVSAQGFEYTLDGATLRRDASRGVSNRLVGEEGRIAVERGTLLVVQEHGSEGPPSRTA